jgi:hypothetical protein
MSKPPPAGTLHWFHECVERGKAGIFSEATTLNPGLAAELLKLNPDNRNVRKSRVSTYAADMRAGRWAYNGEPIIISNDGLINDGQHRLRAMVDANRTLPMLFVFGVDRETRLTVDQGANRGAADYLGMEGIEYAAISATTARLLIAIGRERGARLYRENDVTNGEIRERVENDPKILEVARYASANYKYTRSFCPAGVIATALYMLTEVHPSEGQNFMDRVCRGDGLRLDEPAYAVRNTLLTLGRSSRGAKLEAIFRGWVKHREGKPLSVAKILGHFPELD